MDLEKFNKIKKLKQDIDDHNQKKNRLNIQLRTGNPNIYFTIFSKSTGQIKHYLYEEELDDFSIACLNDAIMQMYLHECAILDKLTKELESL